MIRRKLKAIAVKNPQSASKNAEIIVRLTEKGIHKFRVILKNRPEVLRKEENTYYFNWPISQVEEYFKRFGRDAVIISPEECHESMKAFYSMAIDAYKKEPYKNPSD